MERTNYFFMLLLCTRPNSWSGFLSHWNSSLQVDMSLHFHVLSWCRANHNHTNACLVKFSYIFNHHGDQISAREFQPISFWRSLTKELNNLKIFLKFFGHRRNRFSFCYQWITIFFHDLQQKENMHYPHTMDKVDILYNILLTQQTNLPVVDYGWYHKNSQ